MFTIKIVAIYIKKEQQGYFVVWGVGVFIILAAIFMIRRNNFFKELIWTQHPLFAPLRIKIGGLYIVNTTSAILNFLI